MWVGGCVLFCVSVGGHAHRWACTAQLRCSHFATPGCDSGRSGRGSHGGDLPPLPLSNLLFTPPLNFSGRDGGRGGRGGRDGGRGGRGGRGGDRGGRGGRGVGRGGSRIDTGSTTGKKTTFDD